MAFTKEIPQWENAGQKPPQSKITEGFKPLDHPPADWFNWYMNGTYEALNELQSEAATTTEVTAGLKVLSNDITTHSNAKNNPHAVTKSQVGLGNVDNIKQASKVDFDNHAADKKIHTTEAEKNKWNNGQLSKITADNGTPSIYVRDVNDSIIDKIIDSGLGMGTFYAIAKSKDLPNDRSFRGFFHMTDTTNGKASFGWVYATDYVNNIYTNYLNNNVWSGWSRISNHNMLSEDGKGQLLPNGTDILTLPSGYYYAVGTNVVNMPSKTDSSWFNIYVIDNGNNRKTYHIIRSGDNLHWWGTVHTDGVFKGWDRMLSEKDLSSTWNQVTLVAGTSTKHFAGNPLKFSIRQNELLLRGSFEGVPANETVIARFAQNPSARTVFLGATVGSYGAARFTLEKDGSLRFDGMSANDNSYVSRFEINESIPLW
ncbi:hypothetical protein [Bacillus sp. 1735sda2]|uniref:hypothetical protein n=1 Tax=Bacillus sp. 1735sda2 TaxID=2953806 RepID=UPI0020A22D21|nr:hypothetical protein [Bacillus sp. 1735sda2]MCP1147404.1 hypothetical protein [Bacillus sp. 1735sda2]